MAHQATVEGNARRRNGEPPTQAITRNMADLAHDVTLLAELQTRLFAADARQAAQRAAIPSAALVLAGIAALSCIPIVLMGIAWLLAEVAGLPVYAGFLITAAVVLLICAVLAAVSWVRLRRSLDTFSRSRDEFNSNVRWIKTVLRHRGTRGQPRC